MVLPCKQIKTFTTISNKKRSGPEGLISMKMEQFPRAVHMLADPLCIFSTFKFKISIFVIADVRHLQFSTQHPQHFSCLQLCRRGGGKGCVLRVCKSECKD